MVWVQLISLNFVGGRLKEYYEGNDGGGGEPYWYRGGRASR